LDCTQDDDNPRKERLGFHEIPRFPKKKFASSILGGDDCISILSGYRKIQGMRSDFSGIPEKCEELSSEKNLGWLGYIGDKILPSYIGTIINHYKDPY